MIISMSNLQRISIALISSLFLYARPVHAQPISMTLNSPAIFPGATIPAAFACTGTDQSPALSWSNAPQATKSFALIVLDPDAPGGIFIHWVAYNIPARVISLGSDVPQTAEIPGGGTQGINGFGHIGYNGPCPPPGKMHHYHFRLFALDSTLTPGDNSADALESAMRGHVLATAELVGTFER